MYKNKNLTMPTNFGIVDPSHYVGLTVEKAREKATLNGFVSRIVEEDGESFFVTMELRSDRINFRVKNNTIVDAYPG